MDILCQRLSNINTTVKTMKSGTLEHLKLK